MINILEKIIEDKKESLKIIKKNNSLKSLEDKIKNINIPVLVMHGEVDQIVPFWMGQKIHEMANQPKYSYFTKSDDHMMVYDEKLVFALTTFIESLN